MLQQKDAWDTAIQHPMPIISAWARKTSLWWSQRRDRAEDKVHVSIIAPIRMLHRRLTCSQFRKCLVEVGMHCSACEGLEV